LRVLFVGTAGVFSATALRGLLAGGVAVCGVVVYAGEQEPPIRRVPPERRSPLPLLNPYLSESSAQIAWEREIPLFALSKPGAAATLAALGELRPDLACVACFPRRIPPPLLALPPLGFLNIHPALLPAHRGPAPLFWTLRAGERRSGVTLHLMDTGLDTGPIVAQAPIELPDGISGPQADAVFG
jgi:methionyl-tRNA formyltransferase